MSITACIFDLDGVIVDTAKYHYASWRSIANDLGFDFSEDQNEALKGISRYDSLSKLLEIGNITKSEEEKQKLCSIKNDIYLDKVVEMNESEILPGVKAFIEDLKKNNIKVALGSASKNAIKILDLIGLTGEFEVIIDGNSVSKSKPDPEVFLMGAEQLGVTPGETVVFEDSQKGLEAAVTGKFQTIGIGSIEHLSDADHVMSGFESFTFEKLQEVLS